MKPIFIFLLTMLILAGLGRPGPANSSPMFDLQAAIEAARPGEVIRVPAGLYQGNFVIGKSITLEGQDWPVLDGQNHGTVLRVQGTAGVTVRGLVIRNTGSRLDKEDTGIAIHESPGAVVENNRLENTLFGIDVKDSAGSRVANNVIGAKAELDVAARGDSIRLWYSEKSQVIGNRVSGGRDVVFWYNNGAVIRDNIITSNRYGLHFMYCDDNLIENNHLEGNSVGAFLMYSRRLALRTNIFANNRGPSGYGIGLKDMDGVEATNNLFINNRVGMYFDNSPWSVDVSQHFSHNAFAYNDIGLLFNPSVKRNNFSQNSFIDNMEQVGLTGTGTFSGNGFTVAGQGNFWSDYTGYDADGDGLGDLPYVSQGLFENMMDKNPSLRLFQLSPAQQAIDLGARAFPIFQPKPKLSDGAPLMAPVLPALTPPPAGPAWPMRVIAVSLLLLAAGVVTAGVLYPRANPKDDGQMMIDEGQRTMDSDADRSMIQVMGLTKKYGQVTVVDNVSFAVAAGEAVALWGPNGAGKTTIIRSLLGLLAARGELLVNGYDVRTQGKLARAAIGYVPQELALHADLPARETLLFYARLKQVPAARVDRVLAEVGLTADAAKQVAALSGGMKQRLALAAALLADPPLLILDEPTSNLDTQARDEFFQLLQAQRDRGKTLLFTSHRLEEVELLATRVLVLQNGRLTQACAPAELAGRLGLRWTLQLVCEV